jgi:hypothetical protein
MSPDVHSPSRSITHAPFNHSTNKNVLEEEEEEEGKTIIIIF